MSNRTLNLTEQLYDYFLSISLRETPAMQHLRAETAKLPGAQMQIAPEQGQFMRLLVELIGARRTLDVGTYTGYSALAVATALPADGKVIACDVDEESTKVAQKFWAQAGVQHKVELRLAPALETLQQLLADGQAEQFDFAFIDADKANYPHYYEACLQLIRPGGLIALDNVFQDGRVIDAAEQSPAVTAIRELNQQLVNDERVSLSVVPIADGLSLLRKR